jgi:hypothetical protein
VKSQRKQGSLSLHSGITSLELHLAQGERVTSMKGAVHVRVGHATKELRIAFAQGIGICGGIFLDGRRIGLEHMTFCPELLILLLDGDESVTLLGLQ